MGPCKRERENERGSGGEQKEYIAIIPVLLKGAVECPWDILVNTCKEHCSDFGIDFLFNKRFATFHLSFVPS
jgi:hypothetical protein